MSALFRSLAWSRVVGPCIAGVTHVEELHDGILWVVVDSPAWAAGLEAMASKIIDGLSRTLIDSSTGRPVQEIRWIGLAPRLMA